VDSGLNSVVLANNNEYILLPINEPTFGTKRKSQIQTYLEQNQVYVIYDQKAIVLRLKLLG